MKSNPLVHDMALLVSPARLTAEIKNALVLVLAVLLSDHSKAPCY